MKRKGLIVITLILFFSLQNLYNISAKADTLPNYAQVCHENCLMYADASLQVERFVLPYSYFVKIVAVYENCSQVIYMDEASTYPVQEGFVKTVCLYFTDKITYPLYPKVALTLKSDEVIFADTALTMPKAVISTGKTPVYYGEINLKGTIYCYVYIDGYVGYIKKDGFLPYTLIYNEILLTADNNNNGSNQSSSSFNPDNSGFDTAEIIVMGVIIIAVLILIFFAVTKSNKPSKVGFEDEDD